VYFATFLKLLLISFRSAKPNSEKHFGILEISSRPTNYWEIDAPT